MGLVEFQLSSWNKESEKTKNEQLSRKKKAEKRRDTNLFCNSKLQKYGTDIVSEREVAGSAFEYWVVW